MQSAGTRRYVLTSPHICVYLHSTSKQKSERGGTSARQRSRFLMQENCFLASLSCRTQLLKEQDCQELRTITRPSSFKKTKPCVCLQADEG